MVDELIGYDAIGLSELIRKGDITPTELLDLRMSHGMASIPQIQFLSNAYLDDGATPEI